MQNNNNKNTLQTIFCIAEGSTRFARFDCSVISFELVRSFISFSVSFFLPISSCLLFLNLSYFFFTSVIVRHDERILTVCSRLNWPPVSANQLSVKRSLFVVYSSPSGAMIGRMLLRMNRKFDILFKTVLDCIRSFTMAFSSGFLHEYI